MSQLDELLKALLVGRLQNMGATCLDEAEIKRVFLGVVAPNLCIRKTTEFVQAGQITLADLEVTA